MAKELDDFDDIELIEPDNDGPTKNDTEQDAKPNEIDTTEAVSMQHSLSLESASSSRRKPVHKVIRDDEIEFEVYTNSKNKTEQNSVVVPNKKRRRKQSIADSLLDNSNSKSETNATTTKQKSDKNTHSGVESMHRVAFLRACINYMLVSVGKETINFEETGVTLSKLVNKYKGIAPSDDEVIGLSD